VRLAFADRDSWDAAEVQRLAVEAAGETPHERLDRLRLAEALCEGPFLEEWPYEDWAQAPRRELEALQEEVVAALAEALLDAGEHGGAITRWERMVARDPEREGWHRGLMRAYAAAGDRAMALRQYHACRTVLRRELGLEPGSETRALYARILTEEGSAEPAGARPGGAPQGTVTIVFTDIEGSTEIADRLGDRRWVEVLAAHDRTVRRHAAAHGGHEVKSQGDGLMLAFPSARGAIDFAVGVQRDMAVAARRGDEPLRVRIGLHTGEAIRQGDDFLGRAVIVAARLVAQCRGGEIVVSDLVKRLVDSAGDLAFDAARDVALKGLREPYRIHTVRWEEPSAVAGAHGA
jgi:class 3 adenylate cyclase